MLFEMGEDVLVMKDKVFIGSGQITSVCRSLEELNRYFTKEHPMYTAYQLHIANNQAVFIVSFADDMGQGGYVRHELKRKRMYA